MTYKGHVKNGVVVVDGPVELPEGAHAQVEILSEEPREPTLGEKLLKYAGFAKGLPRDLARNHDHYLYGVPKK